MSKHYDFTGSLGVEPTTVSIYGCSGMGNLDHKTEANRIQKFLYDTFAVGTYNELLDLMNKNPNRQETLKANLPIAKKKQTVDGTWEFKEEWRYYCGRVIEVLAAGENWRTEVYTAMDVAERSGYVDGYNKALEDVKAALALKGIEIE